MFVLATVGGSGSSSWGSNVFFFGAEGRREMIVDSAAGWVPPCVQSLLVLMLPPGAM